MDQHLSENNFNWKWIHCAPVDVITLQFNPPTSHLHWKWRSSRRRRIKSSEWSLCLSASPQQRSHSSFYPSPWTSTSSLKWTSVWWDFDRVLTDGDEQTSSKQQLKCTRSTHKMVNNDKTAAEVAQQGGLRKSSVDKVRETIRSEQREKC